MDISIKIRETWLSRPRKRYAFQVSLFLLAVLFLASYSYLNGAFGADQWMDASGRAVFQQHQYWRLWTTLFAHADLGHILSNSFLFLPFTYFLCAYYSYWFFPVAGIFLGGIVNLVVLTTLPPETHLVGISGVVYWMGAAWLILYLRIERREPIRRRIGKLIIVTTALFIPQTIHAEVSYLSHFLGFISGLLSGWILFEWEKNKFLSAEIRELRIREDIIHEDEWKQEKAEASWV